VNSRYLNWVSDNYHSNESGYYKDIVVGFRVYYTEAEVLEEYNKQKRFCEDLSYRKFAFGFDYEKYF
jgi:hypothetical protein